MSYLSETNSTTAPNGVTAGNAPAVVGAEATTTQSQPIAAVPAQLAKEQTNSGVTGVTPNPTASPAAPDIHANPKTLSGDELLRTTEFACGVVLRDMQVTVALCKEIIARYADRRSTNRPAGKPTVQEAFAAINLNYDTVRKWIQRERVKEIEKLQITDGSEPETDEPLESLKIGEKIVTPDGNAAEVAHQHVTTDRVDVDETIPGYEEPVRKSYKRSELATPAEAESKKKDAPPMKAVALTAGTVILVSGRRYIVVRTPDSGDIRKTRLTVREGKWRLTVSLREVKNEEPTARAAVVAETGTKTAMDEVVAVKAGEGNQDPDGIIAEPAKARTKLKTPMYKEGIDFDPAFLTPPQANELFELMKSQPFADNRVSCGPQVFPAPRKTKHSPL